MDGNWRETLVPGGVFGNLRIVKRLGSGGMGVVFLAENPKGVRCALKVLAPSDASDEGRFEERFRNEAAFALKARHPNLVEVWDAGRDSATGLYYHVMEYLPGGSLRELIATAKKGLPIERAVSIARDVAHALVHIERNGMVHRDIKPDNVLFTADGIAKLADFGISRFEQGDDVHATRAAAVIGTPAYMAPEQMIDSHDVDIRADCDEHPCEGDRGLFVSQCPRTAARCSLRACEARLRHDSSGSRRSAGFRGARAYADSAACGYQRGLCARRGSSGQAPVVSRQGRSVCGDRDGPCA